MKKFLSAVFVMAMLIITATITGSVLAAGPYVFNPTDLGLEDYPVVYYDKDNGTLTSNDSYTASTDATKAFKNMADAVSALNKSNSEGYIILVSDYDLNRTGADKNVLGLSSGDSFPAHSKMLILRGMTKEDGTRSKIHLGGRVWAQGPLGFQNLDIVTISNSETDIQMWGYDLSWGTPGAGYDDVTVSADSPKNGIFPVQGSILVGSDGFNHTSSPVWNLYSGSFGLALELSGAYGNSNINGNVTINNYNCDMSGAKISNGRGLLDKINGNLNINIYGGKLGGSHTLVSGSSSYVDGDINVTISGTPDISALQKFSVADYVAATPAGVKGDSTLNLVDYTGEDKETIISKLSTIAADFDNVLAKTVFVSENGNDSAAGDVNSPVRTYEAAIERAGSYGSINIIDTLTISDVTEDARDNHTIFQGVNRNSKIIINGNYSLGGRTTFSNLSIANGADGAIIANGNTLLIDQNVTTAAGSNGKYIDIIAGKPEDYVPVDITVMAGTYNKIDPSGLAEGSKIDIASEVKTIESGVRADMEINALNLSKGTPTNANVELIDFVDGLQAAKISPADGVVSIEYNSGTINPDVYKFVSIEYYLNIKGTDTITVKPQIKIGETVYTAQQTAAVNGWNVATFDIAAADVFNTFTFYPYGDTVVASHNKSYTVAAVFSQLKNTASPEDKYGSVDIAVTGDYIPVLEDCELGAAELAKSDNVITGLEVESIPFVAGAAAKYTPVSTTGFSVVQNILVDGSISSLRGDFRPYVRVEYYMYARDEDFGDVYPTLTIGGKPYYTTQKLVANQWAVATFNISDYIQEFSNFTLAPYGDAVGVNEWNKLYIQKISFSQTENTVLPNYPNPEMAENGELIPYEYNPGDGKPVVYVATGGTYDGDIHGSVDSTKAYGSLAKAFAAIDKAEGVDEAYVIILNDIDCERALPTHTKMITVRGRENDDDSKEQLQFYYMSKTNGPIAFENLELYWYSNPNPSGSNNDISLASYAEKMVIGKQGVENDVVFKTAVAGIPSLMLTGADITVNSGEVAMRFDEWGKARVYDEVNITLNGGTLHSISGTHGDGSTTDITGDLNININGGKLGEKFKGIGNGGKYTKVVGNYTLTITGGDFTAVPDGQIGAITQGSQVGASVVEGICTVDILDYNGDFDTVRAKIKQSDFDVLNINSFYLADGGEGDGSSPESPMGSLSDAVAGCAQEINNQIFGGRIVICGSGFTVNGTVSENISHSNTILYTSINNAPIKFESGSLELCGPANFKNITFELLNADGNAIVANGNAVGLITGITSKPYNGVYLDIIGGAKSGTADKVDITIKNGDFGNVISGDSVEGDVSIVIDGGIIHGDIVGGTSVANGTIDGNVTISINDGDIMGDVIGGSTADNGVLGGVATIEINGGTFYSDTTITAANTNESAIVVGNAKIEVISGNFDAMGNGQIQAGYGVQVGSKTAIDYENFDGNIAELEGKINTADNSFDVNIGVPAPKPQFTTSDKFMFIIQNLFGDEEDGSSQQGGDQPTVIQDIVVNVSNLKSTVDNSGAFTAAPVTKDSMSVMQYTPVYNSANELKIEGYNCMGKAISLNDYRYLTMKIYVETERTDVAFKPQISNAHGGVFDNPEKANTIVWTSDKALVPNEWNTVTIKITPDDPAFHITRQFYIAPIGNIAANTMVEGEKFYLAELVLSNKAPKPTVSDDEEIYDEAEIIAEFDPVVVDSSSLIRFTGNAATFKSNVTEFDGKKVVKIQPGNSEHPVSIDGAAIFDNTELTPDNALNLLTHRYAVISYYYATKDTESERIPEFDLLGGRIQNQGNVANNVTAKGTAGLKKNQWATAVVKLSGNGSGILTSGFNLRPFGNVAASALNNSDVLYIENITIVSNRPE